MKAHYDIMVERRRGRRKGRFTMEEVEVVMREVFRHNPKVPEHHPHLHLLLHPHLHLHLHPQLHLHLHLHLPRCWCWSTCTPTAWTSPP